MLLLCNQEAEVAAVDMVVEMATTVDLEGMVCDFVHVVSCGDRE